MPPKRIKLPLSEQAKLIEDLGDDQNVNDLAIKYNISNPYVYKVKAQFIDKINEYKQSKIAEIDRSLKLIAIRKAKESVDMIGVDKLRRSSALNLATIAKTLHSVAIPDGNSLNIQINNDIDLDRDTLIARIKGVADIPPVVDVEVEVQ